MAAELDCDRFGVWRVNIYLIPETLRLEINSFSPQKTNVTAGEGFNV